MRKFQGFTLIELLVVLAIVGALSTLVAPSLFRQYEKMQVQSDVRQVKTLLTQISHKAFLSGSSISINFSSQTMRYQYQKKDSRSVSKTFEYLEFERQAMVVNSNGFFDKPYLTVLIGDKSQQVSLDELVN